ncbi:hypothetical protein GWK47_044063 [Chionoecetes opilio]|uniref:Uncharacterized protein n=1 Tax=Chionoecetes opilio TaxID=41210 RepID=A0A8J4Y755_CHIOP|nr:hypothetical protein GWK47_044063 [Chionoecetes opilio]
MLCSGAYDYQTYANALVKSVLVDSASSASTVAIDNKIEQAMVTAAVRDGDSLACSGLQGGEAEGKSFKGTAVAVRDPEMVTPRGAVFREGVDWSGAALESQGLLGFRESQQARRTGVCVCVCVWRAASQPSRCCMRGAERQPRQRVSAYKAAPPFLRPVHPETPQ